MDYWVYGNLLSDVLAAIQHFAVLIITITGTETGTVKVITHKIFYSIGHVALPREPH